MKCQECGRNAELKGRDGIYPLTSLLTSFGILVPLLYSFSRPRVDFRVDCQNRFSRRPWRSFLTLPLYWMCLLVAIGFSVAIFLAI